MCYHMRVYIILDILNIVMIGIAKKLPKHDEMYELHRLLGALLSKELMTDEKLNIISDEHDIPIEDKMRMAMLGFSATIWASYGRTGWYCQISMLGCIIALLEDSKYKNKVATFFLIVIFTCLAVLQMLYNYTRFKCYIAI